MNSTTETTTDTQAAAGAEPRAPLAPKIAKTSRKATAKKNTPKAAKGAKKTTRKAAAKPAAKKATAAVPREFSKKRIVFDLLVRQTGATLDEIMAATQWQRHSVRGFLSTAGKAQKIAAETTDAGRRYRIVK